MSASSRSTPLSWTRAASAGAAGGLDATAGTDRAGQDVVQRREREALHGARLLGVEVVEHAEHALEDVLADGLAASTRTTPSTETSAFCAISTRIDTATQ